MLLYVLEECPPEALIVPTENEIVKRLDLHHYKNRSVRTLLDEDPDDYLSYKRYMCNSLTLGHRYDTL